MCLHCWLMFITQYATVPFIHHGNNSHSFPESGKCTRSRFQPPLSSRQRRTMPPSVGPASYQPVRCGTPCSPARCSSVECLGTLQKLPSSPRSTVSGRSALSGRARTTLPSPRATSTSSSRTRGRSRPSWPPVPTTTGAGAVGTTRSRPGACGTRRFR